MIHQKKKAELIFELHGKKGDRNLALVRDLLDMCVDEVRIRNDTAEIEELKANQGEIAAYKRLKDYLERGLPVPDIKILA